MSEGKVLVTSNQFTMAGLMVLANRNQVAVDALNQVRDEVRFAMQEGFRFKEAGCDQYERTLVALALLTFLPEDLNLSAEQTEKVLLAVMDLLEEASEAQDALDKEAQSA